MTYLAHLLFIFVGNKDFYTVSSLETLYNKSKFNLSLVVPGSYFVSLFVTEVGAGGNPRDPVYNKSKVNPRLWSSSTASFI